MKQFTVKDFITYSGPCFSCQSKINFKIGSKTQPQTTISWQPDVYLTPVVTNDFIEVDLKINYNDGLSLKIFTKTNKFTTSSMKNLIKHLGGT